MTKRQDIILILIARQERPDNKHEYEINQESEIRISYKRTLPPKRQNKFMPKRGPNVATNNYRENQIFLKTFLNNSGNNIQALQNF